MSNFKKTYSLKVKQKYDSKYDNLYNSNNYLGTTSTILQEEVINDTWLKSDSINPLVIGNQVCSEYIDRHSNIGINVPDEDLVFLIKYGVKYEFSRTKPIEDFIIDTSYFDSLDGTNYSDLDNFYKNRVKYSEMVNDLTINPEEFYCYSFPYGGISKATPYFFIVDTSNTIHIVNDDNDNFLIDFLEGYLYINKTQYQPNTIKLVGGFFNLESVLVFANRPLPVHKYFNRNKDYYELINTSDKLDFKIVVQDENYVIMYFLKDVKVKSQGVALDGVEELHFINVKQNEYLYITPTESSSVYNLIYKTKDIEKSLQLWSSNE